MPLPALLRKRFWEFVAGPIHAGGFGPNALDNTFGDAIGYALNMIRGEDVDIMIAGGAEAPLIESAWGGLCANRVMTRHCDDPKRAMRPFDKSRDGFVLGEGGGYMVIEELTHALSRGAKIYAEIAAHGRSCEAYHPLAPHPDGIGYFRAMEKALRQAGVQ